MIAALDVHYDEVCQVGMGAAIVFQKWEDAEPNSEYTAKCSGVQPYVPGEFYKRELPCLMVVLKEVQEPLKLIVVDSYVMLGDKPGLGMHLWEALDRKVPIIGVAKTRFRSADAVEITR